MSSKLTMVWYACVLSRSLQEINVRRCYVSWSDGNTTVWACVCLLTWKWGSCRILDNSAALSSLTFRPLMSPRISVTSSTLLSCTASSFTSSSCSWAWERKRKAQGGTWRDGNDVLCCHDLVLCYYLFGCVKAGWELSCCIGCRFIVGLFCSVKKPPSASRYCIKSQRSIYLCSVICHLYKFQPCRENSNSGKWQQPVSQKLQLSSNWTHCTLDFLQQ